MGLPSRICFVSITARKHPFQEVSTKMEEFECILALHRFWTQYGDFGSAKRTIPHSSHSRYMHVSYKVSCPTAQIKRWLTADTFTADAANPLRSALNHVLGKRMEQ